MATASKTYTFVAGTPAEAARVNQNFDDLVLFLNGEVVHRDGSTPFTSIPVLPGTNPTADNQATRKAYVDAQRDLAGGGSFCHVSTSAAFTVPHATNTAITYDFQDSDIPNWWNLASNPSRIIPTRAGWYRPNLYVNYSTGGFTASSRIISFLRRNGSDIVDLDRYAGSASPSMLLHGPPTFMNGTTDFFDTVTWQGDGASRTAVARFWVEAVRLT